jgi:hypothetical protein
MRMTDDELLQFMEKTLRNVIALRRTKAVDYSDPHDAFSGLRRVAQEMELTEAKTLLVFMAKHWDTIRWYVIRGDGRHSEEIDGRIDDMIVYLILLKAVLKNQ